MPVSVETIRCVLRSWIASEVLTPQITKGSGWSDVAAERSGQIRNRETDGEGDPAYWRRPQDTDLPPWKLLTGDPSGEGQRQKTESALPIEDGQGAPGAEATAPKEYPWYSVILAAMPAREAFKRLDNLFLDEADEGQENARTPGYVVAASIVLDEWGIMLPDSLAIGSFAWGLGHLAAGGAPAGLAGWSDQEVGLKARFADLLAPRGPGGQLRSLTLSELRGIASELVGELGIPADLQILMPCVVETIRRDPPTPDILSSFFLSDLGRVLRDTDHLSGAVASYLGLTPQVDPWDALSDRQRLSELLDPALGGVHGSGGNSHPMKRP